MSAPTREVPVATATEHVETPTTETTRAAAVAPEEATAPGEPNAAVVEETRVKKDAQPVVVEEEREPVVVAPEEEYRDEEPKKEEPKEEKKEETEDVPEPGTEEEMVRIITYSTRSMYMVDLGGCGLSAQSFRAPRPNSS